MPMSSGGYAASLSGCATRPKGRETGSTEHAGPTQHSLSIGSYVTATAEHREPCDSRGSCTVLEQDSKRLNQKEDSQIWSFVIQDAGWGWGPASNGKTLFARPAGSCDWFGCERPHVPSDGGAVWGERGQRCQVVTALAGGRGGCGRGGGGVQKTRGG